MFRGFVVILAKLACRIMYKITVVGRENVPKDTNYIVCPNHIHSYDAILMGAVLPRRLHFMAKEELFVRKPKWFARAISKLGAFPVKRKSSDLGAIRTSIDIIKGVGLRQPENLIIFPEGKRVMTGGLGRFKSGAVLIALKGKVPILPVGIAGRYKFRSKLEVTIGKPIDLSEYYDKKLSVEEIQSITDNLVKKAIDELIGGNTRGIYRR